MTPSYYFYLIYIDYQYIYKLISLITSKDYPSYYFSYWNYFSFRNINSSNFSKENPVPSWNVLLIMKPLPMDLYPIDSLSILQIHSSYCNLIKFHTFSLEFGRNCYNFLRLSSTDTSFKDFISLMIA